MTNATSTSAPAMAVAIEKEQISGFKFPDTDVLIDKESMKIRSLNLERALKLGNLEHNKIKIVFEDSEGIKQVETTVWGVTDKRVILKQGVVIPIHRILDVKV